MPVGAAWREVEPKPAGLGPAPRSGRRLGLDPNLLAFGTLTLPYSGTAGMPVGELWLFLF